MITSSVNGSKHSFEPQLTTTYIFIPCLFGFSVIPAPHYSQKHREHIREQLAVVGQKVSDLDWEAQNPLPDRNIRREDVVH